MTSPEQDRKFLDPAWIQDAACRHLSVEDSEATFFPDAKAAKEGLHKVYCNNCPVRGECLDYALVFDLHGIWGGLTRYERNRRWPVEDRQFLRDEHFS